MRGLSKLITTVFIVVAAVWLSSSVLAAQEATHAKRVLMLYWDDEANPANVDFDRNFRAALQLAAPGDFEFYAEYLESTSFPGEDQSLFLRNYMQQKYADRPIDVIVTNASATLDFLLKYRSDFFPHTPIIFTATELPSAAQLRSGAGATGILYVNSYRRTIDLALKLHPGTEHVFIVSGTPSHDKSWETMARNDLQNFRSVVPITYLTDLTLPELTTRLSTLPERSIILYVWQQSRNRQGKLLESQQVLSLIAPSARVPIYGMSFANVGLGIVGGYVWTIEGNTARVAEMTLRVANGARTRDIPIENAPVVPMFDWGQLERWNIDEHRLPPDSLIRFRKLTMWHQYRWRIIAAMAVLMLQALLIGALLVERQGAGRTRKELEEYKRHLEELVRQRTAELVEVRDQALAANRAKGVFLANMSHELRTPLNAILGFSAIVRRDAGLSDQHRRDLAVVGSSGEHLLGVIDDVLDMAKIESGIIKLEIASLDLYKLVHDPVNMLRERAQAKNLELQIDVSSQTPQFVRSDPGKLRQVLTNLIGNAIKFTDEGSVVLSVDAKPGDNSQVLTLIFDVEDTGIGIMPEDQARIFNPYVQARTGVGKGTGLGLSISRHFVQLLGGAIQLESTPGRGSRFHVEVPVQRAERSEVIAETGDVAPVACLEPGQPDYRILIVEDKRENWLLLQRLLQTVGFDVRVAEDGDRAVELFETWRPHFIWMDMRLPAMDGLEAARRIRKLDGGREVKIVAVTASAFASEREEAIAAGLDDFLRKPYRAREIFSCMARHLGVRYIYELRPPAADGDVVLKLRPEDLAALPTALRRELEDAVISLDRERIMLLVSQISEQNVPLAGMLAQLANISAYTPIFQALESCKTRFTGATA